MNSGNSRARSLVEAMRPKPSGRPRLARAKARLGIETARRASLHVPIKGEITADTATRVIAQLRGNPRALSLFIEINSEGGDVDSALAIHRAIRDHAAQRKVALGVGQVASAAVAIFAAADVRRVLPGCAILLHGVAQDPDAGGRWTARAYGDRGAMLAAKDERLASMLAERCGSPLAVWRAELGTEAPMPLPKAVSAGLIHEVVGETAPLSKAWPASARAAMRGMRRFVHGADAYRFSENYLSACRIGGK